MKRLTLFAVLVLPLSLLGSGFVRAADDSKVKAGTGQVERGAEGMGKGIGTTVSEGTKYSGEKLKEAGQAAEAPAKTAWGNARDGAVGFGKSVTHFFTTLFSK